MRSGKAARQSVGVYLKCFAEIGVFAFLLFVIAWLLLVFVLV